MNLDNNTVQHFPSARLRLSAAVVSSISAAEIGLQRQDELAELPVSLSVTTRTRGDKRNNNYPLTITYGFGQSWFGSCLIATTTQGICWLDLKPRAESLDQLHRVWAPQQLLRDDERASVLADEVFAEKPGAVALHLCGTDFQLRVWCALLQIVSGHYMNYGQLAACIGAPDSARAVGGAAGANGVAVLVPCHRVLPRNTMVGSYRWGAELKTALLQRECSAATGRMTAVA